MPLADIIAQVQARHPGRIMDVELERRRGGAYVYEIELLGPDRRRFEIVVDGASGQVLDAGKADARAFRPLPELLQRVLSEYPGQVVDAELEHGVYQVEVIQDGGVRVQVSVDPADLRIMRDTSRDQQMGRVLPMAEVLQSLLARYPGAVVEAELDRGPDGGYYYEFDIEDGSGRTLTLHVDAFSGEVLREEDG